MIALFQGELFVSGLTAGPGKIRITTRGAGVSYNFKNFINSIFI